MAYPDDGNDDEYDTDDYGGYFIPGVDDNDDDDDNNNNHNTITTTTTTNNNRGRHRGLIGSALDYRSLPPEFQSRREHI